MIKLTEKERVAVLVASALAASAGFVLLSGPSLLKRFISTGVWRGQRLTPEVLADPIPHRAEEIHEPESVVLREEAVQEEALPGDVPDDVVPSPRGRVQEEKEVTVRGGVVLADKDQLKSLMTAIDDGVDSLSSKEFRKLVSRVESIVMARFGLPVKVGYSYLPAILARSFLHVHSESSKHICMEPNLDLEMHMDANWTTATELPSNYRTTVARLSSEERVRCYHLTQDDRLRDRVCSQVIAVEEKLRYLATRCPQVGSWQYAFMFFGITGHRDILVADGTGPRHAMLLVFDRVKKTVELIDPNTLTVKRGYVNYVEKLVHAVIDGPLEATWPDYKFTGHKSGFCPEFAHGELCNYAMFAGFSNDLDSRSKFRRFVVKMITTALQLQKKSPRRLPVVYLDDDQPYDEDL